MNALHGEPICLGSSISDKRICQVFMKYSVGNQYKTSCKHDLHENRLSDSHASLEHINTFLYLSTSLGEIWYRRVYVNLLKIFECHENWHREGYTLPMGTHEINI